MRQIYIGSELISTPTSVGSLTSSYDRHPGEGRDPSNHPFGTGSNPLNLTVQNLRLERSGRPVIAGLSFTVGSGEALILTGANGAGKSTLLRALAGLFTPTSGSIRLDSTSLPPGEAPLISEQCHIVGHQNGLKSSLTAAENLTFWAKFLGEPNPESRVAEALNRMRLSNLAGIPAAYMSAGQKRRLGLARLLVAHRPIWLLDEPTVSLDQTSTADLAALINAHVASGGVAIAATHLPLGLNNARELGLTPPASSPEPHSFEAHT